MDMHDRLYSQKILTNAYKQLIEDLAAPAAPPKPAIKPPATTPGKTPAPSRNPFKIPAPAVKPRPQNLTADEPKEFATDGYVAEGLLREAYEDEAHPKARSFWRDFRDWRGEHPIGKHPVIRQHGDELARGAFGKTDEYVKRHGANDAAVHNAFMLIQRIERQHKEQLERIAIDICVDLWGEEVRPLLRANLEPPTQDQQHTPQEMDQEEAAASDEMIQKRVLANFITQGSAINIMFTAHTLIKETLERIDPRLPKLYSQFAAGSAHQYWMMDLERIAARITEQSIGISQVSVDEEDEGEGEDGPNFVIEGTALMFPVLVQELCKGVGNYLSMAGVEGVGAAELNDLFNRIDNPVDEHYFIQVGHELWRRFLKSKPADVSMAAVTHALHRLTAEEQNQIIAACIRNPDEAKEMLAEITSTPQAEIDIDTIIAGDEDAGDESWRASLDDDDVAAGTEGESDDFDWGASDESGGLLDADEDEEDNDDWWR